MAMSVSTWHLGLAAVGSCTVSTEVHRFLDAPHDTSCLAAAQTRLPCWRKHRGLMRDGKLDCVGWLWAVKRLAVAATRPTRAVPARLPQFGYHHAQSRATAVQVTLQVKGA